MLFVLHLYLATLDPAILEAVAKIIDGKLHDISFCGDKKKRYAGVKKLLEEVTTQLAEQFPEAGKSYCRSLSYA